MKTAKFLVLENFSLCGILCICTYDLYDHGYNAFVGDRFCVQPNS